MKIALARRTYISHIDGVNRFIALLAEGFAKLNHEPIIVGWCYKGVRRNELSKGFKKIHGLDVDIPLHTLREGSCEGAIPWPRIAWDWWSRGSKLLSEEGFDVAIVNGVVPLKFKPKIAVIHVVSPFLTPGELYKFYTKIGKQILKGYDRVVCVSDKVKRESHSFSKLYCDTIPLPLKLNTYKL